MLQAGPLPDPCPVCRGRHPTYRIVRAEGSGGRLVSVGLPASIVEALNSGDGSYHP